MIQRASLSFNLQGASARSDGAQGERNNRISRYIARQDIDLLVHLLLAGRMSAGVPYSQFSILNLKFPNREVIRVARLGGSGLLRRGRLAGRVSQAGVVPSSGIVFQEHDVRIFYGERTDLDPAGKNQRYPFQANGQRGGLNKWTFIERRIIADREVPGFGPAT